MYIKDGIELTPEDVAYNASIAGVSPEQWVEENEFNTVEETDPPKEGKLIGPTVETQLPGPVTEATAGVSSSVDTSLESQEPVLGRFIQVGVLFTKTTTIKI
jgi:hypothetical protein